MGHHTREEKREGRQNKPRRQQLLQGDGNNTMRAMLPPSGSYMDEYGALLKGMILGGPISNGLSLATRKEFRSMWKTNKHSNPLKSFAVLYLYLMRNALISVSFAEGSNLRRKQHGACMIREQRKYVHNAKAQINYDHFSISKT